VPDTGQRGDRSDTCMHGIARQFHLLRCVGPRLRMSGVLSTRCRLDAAGRLPALRRRRCRRVRCDLRMRLVVRLRCCLSVSAVGGVRLTSSKASPRAAVRGPRELLKSTTRRCRRRRPLSDGVAPEKVMRIRCGTRITRRASAAALGWSRPSSQWPHCDRTCARSLAGAFERGSVSCWRARGVWPFVAPASRRGGTTPHSGRWLFKPQSASQLTDFLPNTKERSKGRKTIINQ
jgi:hypothetical protein